MSNIKFIWPISIKFEDLLFGYAEVSCCIAILVCILLIGGLCWLAMRLGKKPKRKIRVEYIGHYFEAEEGFQKTVKDLIDKGLL